MRVSRALGSGYKFGKDPGIRTLSMGAGHVKIPWDIGVDLSYQNTAEFVAGLLGLIILIRERVRYGQPLPKAVAFRGDSVSALT
jgi:hypothetical protein